ncbi:hypothetical protein S83_054468, partial [Arachis hypogaea]
WQGFDPVQLKVTTYVSKTKMVCGSESEEFVKKMLGNVEHQPRPERPSQLPVLDVVLEVAIYIH